MTANGDDIHVGTTVDRETKAFVEDEAERIGITEAAFHRRLLDFYRASRESTVTCPHCEGPLEFDLTLPDDEGSIEAADAAEAEFPTGMAGTEVDLPQSGVITVEGALALFDEAIQDPEAFGISSLARVQELEERVEALEE